jgi:hypothetical protein
MSEFHEILYPPKENDTRILHRRYDTKERLVAWSLQQDDYFLLFRVTSVREVPVHGKSIDAPESIECRASLTDIDPDAAFADTFTSYDYLGNVVNAAESNHLMRGRYVWTPRERMVEDDLSYIRARYFDPVPGHAVDDEILCNRARCYDPSIGRWINEDPVGYDSSEANQFRYPVAEAKHDSTKGGTVE